MYCHLKYYLSYTLMAGKTGKRQNPLYNFSDNLLKNYIIHIKFHNFNIIGDKFLLNFGTIRSRINMPLKILDC